MKVFYCTDHATVWPAGGASIIVATSKANAISLLDQRLREHGLDGMDKSPFTLHEINVDEAEAIILRDGDY